MKTTEQYGERFDLALSTWVKLARAFTAFNKVSAESIKSFKLTQPQFSVIEALGHLGAQKIGVLCDKMLVSGGNMTLVLDNLENLGFIERVHCKEDRRAIMIQLTEKGQKLFLEIFPKHAQVVVDTMSALNTDEQKQLGDLLKKLGMRIS